MRFVSIIFLSCGTEDAFSWVVLSLINPVGASCSFDFG